ncbi:MAG: transporter substrate-binding domain-containing protein [Clostridia bacterium]|nr:transporter substrate-binding domain-containing protein [Clostridia bacterium]MBQ7046152.1 transporter substrate-binding domain-containing protein [Oscillospiraceae bacterium]
MKKRVAALVLAVLMMVLAFGFTGCTGNEKTDWAYIEDKGELVIGITYFQPMNYEGADGKLTGFETEFAEAVCAKLKVKPVFQKIDWNSKVQELKSKNIDVIWNGMTVRDELLAEMDVSSSYMKNTQTAVIRKADADKYKDLASMAGAIVVAEAGSAGEVVVKADAGLSQKYTPVDTQVKTFTEVKGKTADIAVVDAVTAAGTIGEGTSYDDLMILSNIALGEPEEYAIGIRKGETELTAKINAAIKELYDDGTLDKLADKYNLTGRIIAQ